MENYVNCNSCKETMDNFIVSIRTAITILCIIFTLILLSVAISYVIVFGFTLIGEIIFCAGIFFSGAFVGVIISMFMLNNERR